MEYRQDMGLTAEEIERLRAARERLAQIRAGRGA
jgi:hypothetical protein